MISTHVRWYAIICKMISMICKMISHTCKISMKCKISGSMGWYYDDILNILENIYSWFFSRGKWRHMNCLKWRSMLCDDIGCDIHRKIIESKRSKKWLGIFNTIIVSKQPFGATWWLWSIENMTQHDSELLLDGRKIRSDGLLQ